MPSTMPFGDPNELHLGPSNRLVLCFDGTGNKFAGNPGDTNIVKIYNMLNRSNLNQMHYYQPGIGTYPAEGPVNVSPLRSFTRKFEAVLDQALATSFDSHVIAGYRFLMRYYKPGDRIYVFGFSRGAFTARFLSRMVAHVGLLSMGNEELVPFAYQVYQEYEKTRGDPAKEKANKDYMNSFKQHFCRTERETAEALGVPLSANESGIKVHFLGLFDCVSSVGTLDIPMFKKTPPLPAVRGTAEHIRHAVAIDERRVKFKAALFAQEQSEVPEDIKEVWFPGNHGDIGGGWDRPKVNTTAGVSTDVSKDYFQLSDIALKWMIDEIDSVEEAEQKKSRERGRNCEKLAWNLEYKGSFLRRFHENMDEMIEAKMHDTMTWNGGSASGLKIFLWNFMEYFPFIKRWEFVKAPIRDANSNSSWWKFWRIIPFLRGPTKLEWRWEYVTFPLNKGNRRDIPSTALFHNSVIDRMRLPATKDRSAYKPNNPLWVRPQLRSALQARASKKEVGAVNGVTHGTAKGHADASASEPELVETNLAHVAEQVTSRSAKVNGSAAISPGQPHFAYNEENTVGSVSISGQNVAVGAKKWDRIYSVGIETD